jgi:CRISPR/Cas system-associated exonuclease Cas4 (RecB family)
VRNIATSNQKKPVNKKYGPKSFAVGDVTNWYYYTPPEWQETHHLQTSNSYKVKREPLPYHKWIFRRSFLITNYPATKDYTYVRTKGMLVHNTIDSFIETKLPSIPLYFSKDISYYRLWYHLRRSLYLTLLQQIKLMRIMTPQVEVWYPFLLDEGMKSLDLYLNHVYNSCIDRLMINHELELILEDLTPMIHERTSGIWYKGYHISFKPDWIVFELNKAVVIEYKTGQHYPWRVEKDRLQVLLFAWLFEKYFNIPVDRCEVYYLDAKKCEVYPINSTLKKEVQSKVDTFIQHLNSNYNFNAFDKKNQQLTLKMESIEEKKPQNSTNFKIRPITQMELKLK